MVQSVSAADVTLPVCSTGAKWKGCRYVLPRLYAPWVLTLHDTGTLTHIGETRSSDPYFHANPDRVETWCSASKPPVSTRRQLLLQEIRSLLSRDANARRSATQLLTRVTGYYIAHLTEFKHSRCKNEFHTREQREKAASALREADPKLQEKTAEVELWKGGEPRIRSSHE